MKRTKRRTKRRKNERAASSADPQLPLSQAMVGQAAKVGLEEQDLLQPVLRLNPPLPQTAPNVMRVTPSVDEVAAKIIVLVHILLLDSHSALADTLKKPARYRDQKAGSSDSSGYKSDEAPAAPLKDVLTEGGWCTVIPETHECSSPNCTTCTFILSW